MLFITSFYDIGIYKWDASVEIIAESDCREGKIISIEWGLL